MSNLRDAARQALEVWDSGFLGSDLDKAMEFVRAALAEHDKADAINRLEEGFRQNIRQTQDRIRDKVLSAPEQPERTLTDEVIADLWHQNGGFHHHFARAVERYLKGEK